MKSSRLGGMIGLCNISLSGIKDVSKAGPLIFTGGAIGGCCKKGCGVVTD
jgi:hypothetical protein